MESLKRLVLYLMLWIYVIASIISGTSGSDCASLDGSWYNELGSKLNLRHSEDGQLKGLFQTAVERESGSSATNHSEIFGVAPYNRRGSVFGFSVMYRGGLSTASWTGQCLVCSDGAEVLETSWLIKTRVNGCSDTWKSTMIGQNTFRRNETAARQSNPSGRRKRQALDTLLSRDRTTDDRQPCKSLSGHWYNQVGSEMIINTHADGSIKGEYRTAVERCQGAAGQSHSEVFGASNTSDPSSTVSLFVVWSNGGSITGWTGQCHVCGENNTETLLLTWLLRSKIDSCHDNWLATNYGETIFTRHEQISGPRRYKGTHTPGEAGEAGSRSSVPCSALRSVQQSSLHIITCLLSFVMVICFYE